MNPPELVIRRASRADVDLVLSGDDLFDCPPTAEWTQDFLDRGSNLLVLALDGDTPVGMLVAVETSHLGASPDLFVYGIRVREEFRGQRLAHRLQQSVGISAPHRDTGRAHTRRGSPVHLARPGGQRGHPPHHLRDPDPVRLGMRPGKPDPVTPGMRSCLRSALTRRLRPGT